MEDKEFYEVQCTCKDGKREGVMELWDENGKPVHFSPSETRVVMALSYLIGKDIYEEDVAEVVKNPFSEREVVRDIDIIQLSIFLYGRSSNRNKKRLLDIFYRLHSTFQICLIELKDEKTGEKKTYRHIQPLIQIKQGLDEAREMEKGERVLRIAFGKAFFVDLDKRFSILSPKIFEVWRKRNGNKGELFPILLNTILSVYYICDTAAKKTEKRLLKENNDLPEERRLSPEELQKKIEEEKKQAWCYEINFSSIKKRLTVDYYSNKQYRFRFRKDLEKAIKDLMEIGIISQARTTKVDVGEKVVFLRQARTTKVDVGEKVVFLLNEKYKNKQR